MKKLALPIMIIIGLIALSLFPSVWIARILAVIMFVGLIVIGNDRRNFSQQQLDDYIILLEIIAVIFMIHIAASHGGVNFGGID